MTQQEISLDLLRRFDPFATSPLVRDKMIYYFFKRALDVLVSLVALIFLAPIMAIIALAIKLDSPGPVFFAQKRIGATRWTREGFSYWKKADFHCYKFRSMYHNCDQNLHKSYVEALMQHNRAKMAELQGEEVDACKLVHDPRITRVGYWLRKTSLDELPQLWNILIGDMTLVGPRPSIPYEYEMYKSWYYPRLKAKQGLTGLWQVTARSSADFDEMVNLDIEYVENQSFWLDIKIIFKTPLVVISGKDAH